MITVGFAGLLLLLMFLIRWTIPALEKATVDQGIFVELNIPDDPIPPARGGGGGGGNPVQAAGPAGTAPQAPQQPGTTDDAKDVDDDDDKSTPAILKPDNPKPTAKTINENKSPVKTEPKPDPLPPAPPPRVPKAVVGRTLSGGGTGGGAAEDYDRSGGSGTGSGVGRGSGTGGGSGTGSGGGNGSGTGGGAGASVKNGDRRIISSYNFQGDLDKATVFAFVKVSPDGVGEFVGIAKGSTASSAAYKTAIMQYLRNMKFNKSDHESMVTVQFNFRVNG